MLERAYLNIFCLSPGVKPAKTAIVIHMGCMNPGTCFGPCLPPNWCFLILCLTHDIDLIPQGGLGTLGWQLFKCIVSHEIESPELCQYIDLGWYMIDTNILCWLTLELEQVHASALTLVPPLVYCTREWCGWHTSLHSPPVQSPSLSMNAHHISVSPPG